MANRRMFAKSITNSSSFLMMSSSAQNLYFHLGMNADDDGYCEHFTIMRMTDSKPDDLKLLHAKRFVKVFDDKVLVILDWKEHNLIRSDRYAASKYKELYPCQQDVIPNVIPAGDVLEPQVRLGKVRLGKVTKNTVEQPRKKRASLDGVIDEDELAKKVITLFSKMKANGRDHDVDNETHKKKFNIIIKALKKKGFKTDDQILAEFERVFKNKKSQHDDYDHHWKHFRITTLSAKDNFLSYMDEDDHESLFDRQLKIMEEAEKDD